MSASIAGVEVGFRPLYFDPFFFFLTPMSFFSPSLESVHADPTVVGVGSRIIKYKKLKNYIYIYIYLHGLTYIFDPIFYTLITS